MNRKSIETLVLVLVGAALLAGCAGAPSEDATANAEEDVQELAGYDDDGVSPEGDPVVETPAPVQARPASTPARPATTERPAAAPAPAPVQVVRQELTVPAGTLLTVELEQELSSATNLAGDEFAVRIVEPVAVDGRDVIGPGSTVLGRVVEAVPSKKIGGTARLQLEFVDLVTASGDRLPIAASFVQQAKGQTKKDAATIGGAAAGGAILGRIIGHDKGEEGKGTAVGAAVGALPGGTRAAR